MPADVGHAVVVVVLLAELLEAVGVAVRRSDRDDLVDHGATLGVALVAVVVDRVEGDAQGRRPALGREQAGDLPAASRLP